MNQTIDKIMNFITTVIIVGIILIVCILSFGVFKFYQNSSILAVNNNRLTNQIKQQDESEEIEETKEEKVAAIDTNTQTINPYEAAEAEITYEVQNTSSEKIERFYYNQLDEYSKIIYDEIYNRKGILKTGTINIDFGTRFNTLLNTSSGQETLYNAYQEAWNTFLIDNPELFYINVTKIYLYIRSITKRDIVTYEVSINIGDNVNFYTTGFENQAQVEETISKVENVRNQMINNAKGTDVEKMKYVHDWLVDNVSYDQTISKSNIYDVYGTLINKVVVCEGYARTFKYILDGLNLPCIIVIGTGTNSEGKTENHAWNYVKVNNKWYGVDVTWDDPIIIGGGTLPHSGKYKYFLKGYDTFSDTHMPIGRIIENGLRYAYPELNKEAL